MRIFLENTPKKEEIEHFIHEVKVYEKGREEPLIGQKKKKTWSLKRAEKTPLSFSLPKLSSSQYERACARSSERNA